MSRLEFVRKLYNGRNCYSDHMSDEEIKLIHLSSGVESIIREMIKKDKLVFITGNPGDGKTFIIKALSNEISEKSAYVETDLNNVKDYSPVVSHIIQCYEEKKPAVIAVNEYPFIQLCKEIKHHSQKVYVEIMESKKNAIAYSTSQALTNRVAVVDLNDRNLLGTDYGIMTSLINRIIELLKEDEVVDRCLKRNIQAMSQDNVRDQIASIFQLAAAECEHFAMRDILGAVAFMFTSCTMDESEGVPYYTAIFEGTNDLLLSVQQYDPIYLTSPEIDEQLWNGEIKEGWLLDAPIKFPKEFTDVEEAVECFKSIKRQYYFENRDGKKLLELQPEEVFNCLNIFTNFESQKRKIKEGLIQSINKLFLPSLDDRKQLHIWTTHRYDMSQEATVAISSRTVDSSELEIFMPRPADWLKGLEYVPDHIILRPKGKETPELIMDLDFLRTLDAVENGYPTGMLAPQYEQAAAMFLQKLFDNGLSEPNDDGEVLIASRTKGYKMNIYIQNGKYEFEEES
ncbi:MAG: zeta toxin family protein [Lachnospiraceae bacterium]|nr:zeta toxin family protein [Lachnospiraceae bacterium]